MKGPLITGASEHHIEDKPPPPRERTGQHKWLNERARRSLSSMGKADLELYLSKLAEEKIRNHALSKVDERLEVLGFLLGNVYRHEGKEYTVVRDVATTDLEATSVRVKFQRKGFEELFRSLDECGFDYLLVGWYHSHPGHRCFMSETDIETQRMMFNQPYHGAIVIDPLNQEIEAFRLRGAVVQDLPFAVYWDEYQNPYFGESVRRRRVVSGAKQARTEDEED